MKNRFLVVLISILIAIVLGLGGIFLLSMAISGLRAIVRTDNVNVDLGTVNYLTAYYKLRYINTLRADGVDADDSADFWESDMGDGVSYGDDFKDELRKFITETVAAADIYVTSHGYTPEDKLSVAYKTDEILAKYADGSVSEFNAIAEKHGFDFNDFQNASALLYKASRANKVAFGEGGKNLLAYPELCEEYLAEYSRVALIFFNSTHTYATDENGEYITDSEGEHILRELSEEELAARTEAVARLREAMNSGTLTREMLIAEIPFSDPIPEMKGKYYYLHPDSEATARLAEERESVVNAAIEMTNGEIGFAEYDGGVCFIFKSAAQKGAYEDKDNPTLYDFMTNAAEFHYPLLLSQTGDEVEFESYYDRLSLLDIPMIGDFYVRSFDAEKRTITPEIDSK